MKKIKYLIITLVVISFVFLSNAVIYKITDYNILVNAAKVFLAWDIGITENKIISLEDENVYVEAQANWVEKDIVEVSLGLSDNLYLNDKSKDVVFMLDTSIISNYKFNDIVDESMLAIESLLKNENNKVAIITFDEEAKLIQDFTNDVENVRNSFNDIEYKYERNYNSALNKLDELLNTYEKKEDRDLFVIFISNSDATKDVNTHKSTYKMLKEKYSYLSINGILYDYNNSSNDINEVSDTQFFADEFELMNTLSKIINNGVTFEKFKVNFDITLYYEIVGFSTNNGEVTIGEDNLLVWDMSGKHLVTGYDMLKVRLKLKKDYQNIIGYYQINDSFSIDYRINDIDKISQSREYLQLRNGFEVSYNLNLPSGCSISRIDTTLHNVYSRVNLHDDLYCEGYEFLGYKIDNVEMINNKSFVMPTHSVVINAKWSKSSITVNLNGTVHELPALYDKMRQFSQNTSIVKKYTGNHKDSFALPASKDIYHFYAENDAQVAEALNKNNVLFAGHCWQILRTTDTGGVKMMYNGEPDSEGKCGTDRGEHAGYNDVASIDLSSEYYYGTSYDFNSTTKTFTLSGDLEKMTWNESTSDSILGKYTCLSNDANSTCETLYLVFKYIDSSTASAIKLEFIKYFSSFGLVDFNQGQFSPTYAGYMYGDIYEFSTILNPNITKHKYGSGFSWDGSKYTLIDPIDFLKTDQEELLSSHHYVCLEENVTECDAIGYVYYYRWIGDVYYMTLKDGDTSINDILDNMFKKNTNDSIMKTGIDAWYERYLINYSDYLEDTIYCNNRAFNYEVSGWNPNGGSTEQNMYFKGKSIPYDLTCENITDQFSTQNNYAKLKYPIGLATVEEMNLLNLNAMRDGKLWYALSSPNYYYTDEVSMAAISPTGYLSGSGASGTLGVRPVISLKPGVLCNGGNGSVDSPYVIE